MAVISIVGIRMTARTQVVIGVLEYLILIVFAVWGLIWVLGHHAGTVGITSGWFSLHGIGGKGSLVGGFLITVFMFTGWDGTLYVNEEVKHRRENPGRAAMLAVAHRGGPVHPRPGRPAGRGLVQQAEHQQHLGPRLPRPPADRQRHRRPGARARAGPVGDRRDRRRDRAQRADRLRHRQLPGAAEQPGERLGQRFKTPVVATVVASLILLALGWVYLLTTSVQNTFSYVLNNTGILYATFYCITALSAMVYYRRRVLSSASDALTLGMLPLASIAFLGLGRHQVHPGRADAAQNYSLLGFLVVGIILMIVARFGLQVAVLRDQAGELDAGHLLRRGLSRTAQLRGPAAANRRAGAS